MIKYKRNTPIKADSGRVLRVLNAKEKASLAKKDNERDLAISLSYFDLAPSILNLARGVYHWARGSEWSPFSRSEDPDDYRSIQGTAPIVGAPAKAIASTISRWLNPKTIATSAAAIGIVTANLNSNKSRVMPISRSVNMASEAANDTILPASRDTILQTSGATPLGELPNNKKNLKDKAADGVNKVKDKVKQIKSKPIGEKAWKVYKWSWHVPTAIDVVGNIAGAIKNPDTYSPTLKALDYRTRPVRVAWDLLGKAYNPQSSTIDSIPDNLLKVNLDTTKTNQPLSAATPQYETLNSIRKAAQQASLKYLDSLESNQ